MSGPHPDPLSDMLSKPHELDGRFERERDKARANHLTYIGLPVPGSYPRK